jgi:holdfast attachment protein HfaA
VGRGARPGDSKVTAKANRRAAIMVLAASLASATASIATLSGPAAAQTMNANSATFNAGYGRSSDQENQPVNVAQRDASGNLVVENGLISGGASGSVFAGGAASASSSVSGAIDSFTGAGGSASAIGNNLTVVTQGNYNTVIVNATQTNTGDVTATTSTSGK